MYVEIKMNALAFYRLTTVPEKEKSVASQPVKKQRLLEQSVESVKYICKKCNTFVFLSAEDVVQCSKCNHRVVKKISTTTAKTYDAV